MIYSETYHYAWIKEILRGKDRQKQNRALEKVLQRARECGIKYNQEKCEFEKKEITFFGHLSSDEL